MNPLQRLVRRWLDVDEHRHDVRKTARTLSVVTGELTMLQGLIHHQTDVTLEALRRAAWQSDAEMAQTQAVHRALPIARGTGYRIPFLNWLVEQRLDSKRLVVISRGGRARWYRHLTTRHVDVLDLMTTDEFRERTSKGKRKQYTPKRDFEVELLERVRVAHGLPSAEHIHAVAAGGQP